MQVVILQSSFEFIRRDGYSRQRFVEPNPGEFGSHVDSQVIKAISQAVQLVPGQWSALATAISNCSRDNLADERKRQSRMLLIDFRPAFQQSLLFWYVLLARISQISLDTALTKDRTECNYVRESRREREEIIQNVRQSV